jgi:hypothetical protein
MRSLVGLFLVIGIVLLLVGFFATDDCPDKSADPVSKVMFVIGWHVYLYDEVVRGPMPVRQWLHHHACEARVPMTRTDLVR